MSISQTSFSADGVFLFADDATLYYLVRRWRALSLLLLNESSSRSQSKQRDHDISLRSDSRAKDVSDGLNRQQRPHLQWQSRRQLYRDPQPRQTTKSQSSYVTPFLAGSTPLALRRKGTFTSRRTSYEGLSRSIPGLTGDSSHICNSERSCPGTDRRWIWSKEFVD